MIGLKKQFSWTLSSTLLSNIIQMIVLLIIARSVGPDLFGVFSLALVTFGLVGIFQDIGIGSYVIKYDITCNKKINALVVICLTLGIAMQCVIILFSEFFSKTELLKYILILMSFNFPINSFLLIDKALLEKKGRFDLLSKIEILSSIFSACVSLFLLYCGYDIYSLVILGVAKSIVNCIGFKLFSGLKTNIRIGCDFSIFKDAINFSWGIICFNIVNYFGRNSDKYFISSRLGDYWLGGYSLAYRFLTYPLQLVTQVVTRVLYPRLSISYGSIEYKNLIISTVSNLSILFFPLFSFGYVFSHNFVTLFFDNEWNYMGDILQYFCLIGVVQILGSLCGAIFMSSGRTNLMFYFGIFNSSLYLIAFWFGSLDSIELVCKYYMIANYIILIPTLYIMMKISNSTFFDFNIRLLIIATVSILNGFLLYYLKVNVANNILAIVISLLVTLLVVYMLFFINKRFNYENKH